MKIGLKKFTRPIAIWLILFQIAIFLLGIRTASGGTTDPNFDDLYASNQGTNVLKILAALENKIEDQQVLEKTKEKLFTLNDGQTRLIASLSDRVAMGGNSARASIAFLLVTVLITLL